MRGGRTGCRPAGRRGRCRAPRVRPGSAPRVEPESTACLHSCRPATAENPRPSKARESAGMRSGSPAPQMRLSSARVDPVMPAALAIVAVILFAVLLVAGMDAAIAAAAAGILLLIACALALVGWHAARGRESRLGAVADALRKERADERE